MRSPPSSRVVTRACAAFVAASVVTAVGARSAHADPACINAYEQAQTLRKDGRLVAAKAQAAMCARAECPALLTKDCSRWLGELEASTPTVVFDARTAAGAERTDVRVKLDGAVLVPHIDGKAVAVDPGARKFVFEAEGAPPVEKAIVVREGEKNRKVTVTIADAAPPVATTVSRPIPLGFWIFGGVSVVALASSAVFAIDGLAQKSDLDACKPRCSSEDVDAMSRSFTFADVALGAGLMAGAAAAYVFFTRPAVEETKTEARAAPFVIPLASGAAAGVSARF